MRCSPFKALLDIIGASQCIKVDYKELLGGRDPELWYCGTSYKVPGEHKTLRRMD